MTAPEISVVVASRDRPRWLGRCLTALGQLDYPVFEVVVSADSASLATLAAHPVLAAAKMVVFGSANLSAARNAGIAQAAGEFCAFIDDDAVPEPMWLARHAEALAATGTVASAGYVRGRNGISFQSCAAAVDGEAESHTITAPESAAVPELPEGRALKLIGTNAVVNRGLLAKLGGFDTAFRWFLEDTDLSLRLAAAGHAAAVAPGAEVHHGFAASPRRTSRRCPRRLFDIGRSTAVFLRRHPGADAAVVRSRMAARERARLVRHMVQGTCEPDMVPLLLADLEVGWEDGLAADLPPLVPLADSLPPFRPVPAARPGHRVLTGRLLSRRRLFAAAAQIAADGGRASVFSFSLTSVRHHLRYADPGFWVQTGGQFGRSVRREPPFRWCRFVERLRDETGRIANQRGIGETGPGAWPEP